MLKADESRMMFETKELQKKDKEIFVENVGWLLSQTREGIRYIKYEESNGEEFAVIVYEGGSSSKINITCDSYTAIVNDIIHGL